MKFLTVIEVKEVRTKQNSVPCFLVLMLGNEKMVYRVEKEAYIYIYRTNAIHGGKRDDDLQDFETIGTDIYHK